MLYYIHLYSSEILTVSIERHRQMQVNLPSSFFQAGDWHSQ